MVKPQSLEKKVFGTKLILLVYAPHLRSLKSGSTSPGAYMVEIHLYESCPHTRYPDTLTVPSHSLVSPRERAHAWRPGALETRAPQGGGRTGGFFVPPTIPSQSERSVRLGPHVSVGHGDHPWVFSQGCTAHSIWHMHTACPPGHGWCSRARGS